MTNRINLEPGEIGITVDHAQTIYVGKTTVDAIRGDANRQADAWLREAVDLWDDLDVTDLDQIRDMEFKIGMVSSALSALRGLAPVELDEDDD